MQKFYVCSDKESKEDIIDLKLYSTSYANMTKGDIQLDALLPLKLKTSTNTSVLCREIANTLAKYDVTEDTTIIIYASPNDNIFAILSMVNLALINDLNVIFEIFQPSSDKSFSYPIFKESVSAGASKFIKRLNKFNDKLVEK